MKRTIKMRLLELEDPRRRDIREILLEAYEQHGDVARAAESLGITHSCYLVWLRMLGGRLARRVEFPSYEHLEQAEALPLEVG